MKQLFGYVRVSTVKQGDGVSLEAQKDAILNYAERNGIRICRWFEETVTAAKVGRPKFNKMVSELKNGQAAGMVVHKIDRSSRNYFDWASINELADSGIEIHATTESLDFCSRGGRLAADIQMVFAADYVRNLKEEIHKGQQGQLKKGLYPWPAPIGYVNNGPVKLKTRDAAYAPLVIAAYELYGSGEYSLRSLQQEMKKRGFRSKTGRIISRSSLENILLNPFYCGVIKIKKTGQVWDGAHEKLISVESFKRVQDIKAGKAIKKITRHNYTYRGLFNCGLCNRILTGERQKGIVYYRCHDSDCATKTIREDYLDVSVLEQLKRVELPPADIENITQRLKSLSSDEVEAERERAVKLQIDQLDARRDRLTDALLDGVIDDAEFKRRKASMLLERSHLDEQLEQVQQNRVSDEMIDAFFERLKSLANTYFGARPAKKRQIVSWATSNRSVQGKSLYLEPSDWLISTESALAGLGCGDAKATFRTDKDGKRLLKIILDDHFASKDLK